MQRIGGRTARMLKALAGLDREQPVSSAVYALYVFLLCVAMIEAIAWALGV